MKRLEKILYPNEGELVIDENYTTMRIVDAELDGIDCQFNGDNCVELNTKTYSYITLTEKNLLQLLDAIEEVKTL